MRWFSITIQLSVLLGVVSACCAETAVGPAPAGRLLPLPEFPTAQVAIPWSELKALLEERRAPETKEEKPKEKPPVEWTISEATYTARAETKASARIEAAFDIYVWKPEGWSEIPLIAPTVAPLAVALDGKAAPLVNINGDMRGLVLDSPGPHRVEISFFAPLTATEGVVAMEFAAAPAAINRVHLEVPVPDAILQAPDAAGLTATRDAKGVTADLAFRRSANIAVSWRLPAKIEAPKTPAPPEPPSLTCAVSTLATLSERVMGCESTLAYSVQRGSTDTFAFTLPARANVLQVEGNGSAWSRAVDGSIQKVVVKVNHPVTDQYTVVVRYETGSGAAAEGGDSAAVAAGAGLGTMVVPELTALDVTRQSAWIGIVGRDNVEIAPAPDIAGYTRVDLTELPAALGSLAPTPILLAYRKNDQGGTLALDVRKLADVPVRPATIDAAEYTTLLTKEGARMTRAVFTVRNNVQQYLRVRIGDAAKVSTVSVGGTLVKPARDDNDDATVLVPLQQSAIHGRVLGAFEVELVYTEPVVALPKQAGDVALALPAADLPIERVSWDVWVPETFRIYDVEGDLSADSIDTGAGGETMRAQRTPKGARTVQIRRLREGIERFLITDINNPAGSVGGGEKYVGDLIKEPAVSAAVAGILPVAVDLPLQGRAYAFSRILVDEGTPLPLTVRLISDATASRMVFAQRAVGFAVGCFVCVALRKRRARHVLLAVTSAAALVTLFAYGYPLGLVAWRSATRWFIAGAVVASAPVIVDWVRARAWNLRPRRVAMAEEAR